MFINKNPEFRLPPPHLAYDAYGDINWNQYYNMGLKVALHISELIKKNIDKPSISICEWGCGPARILRHLANCFQGQTVKLYGFDYNQETIQWCTDNFPNITFSNNLLAPPLQYHSPKLPGLGDVDWGQFFSNLTDSQYRGAVCVEVEDRAYEESLDSRHAALRQCCDYLRQFVPSCKWHPWRDSDSNASTSGFGTR